MKRRLVILPLIGSIAALMPAVGAEIQKLNNVNALNLGSSWAGGVVPGPADVAVWNSAVTTTNSTPLGGDLSWLGIKVTDVSGTGNVVISNGSSANTLTIGSAGIDLSASNAPLQIQSRVLLSGNQEWNVPDLNPGQSTFGFNFSEDMSFTAQGSGIPFNLGGFEATKTGIGTLSITSGYTISNGTFTVNEGVLAISGAGSRSVTLNSNVTINVNAGGTFRIQGASGATTMNGTTNLNGGTVFMVSSSTTNAARINGTVNVNAPSTILLANPAASGTTGPVILNGNLNGSSTLTVTNTTSGSMITSLSIGGNNSAFTGTISFGGTAGRASRLTSANAGAANATWNINSGHTLEVDGVTVNLGTLTGAGTITNSSVTNPVTLNIGAGNFAGVISNGSNTTNVTKVGSGTLLLSGTNTYTGTTTVNGGALIAIPGSLNFTTVNVADGAEFGVRIVASSTTLFLDGLSLGSSTGSTLSFDLGSFGIPLAVPLNTGSLNIAAPTQVKISGSDWQNGSFPLFSYSGAIGGLGFGGLSLVLPPRVVANLVDNAGMSQVALNISGFDTPRWIGNVDGKWDIDDGGGTGTANWALINAGTPTRYLETIGGNDRVVFDDMATGTTIVELTTDLRPTGVLVNNNTLEYQFTGSGRITGTAGLIKDGTGILRIRNVGVNDYSGGTTINAGTVEVGDGVTDGVGTLGSGPIVNNGTLILNRPDSFTVPNSVSGAGSVVKNGAGSVTLAANVVQSGPVVINDGTFVFTAGGNLSGPISGSGSIQAAGGTVEISGFEPNTYTGTTVVSAGTLRLNKVFGTDAVPGDILITGSGVLTLIGGEQIPDTATITFTGTSGDSLGGSSAFETVSNVVVNPSVETGQLIMRNGFVVSNLATVQSGILGIASGHAATVNEINMTGGIVRLGGNGGPSTLNVGTGGITASGGEIQVKFTATGNNAFLNMNGDFTGTGDVLISNGGAQPGFLSQIILNGERTFDIAEGTKTTVQPDITGPGDLVKEGEGVLQLLSRMIDNAGQIIVNAGTLLTNAAAHTGTTAIFINDGGNLAIPIPIDGSTLNAPSVSLGTTGGARISFELNEFGNPISPGITTTTLTTTGTNTLAIVGLPQPGTFPLIQYTGTIGGDGFAGLSVKLPLRVAGNLVDNAAQSLVEVSILGTDTPYWNGNVNGNWDIDDGSETGTANWKGAYSNNALRYLETGGETDHVVFDDSATGTTNVNLVATLSPSSITVINDAKNYTFGGAGKLTGSTGLIKAGSGTLTIANTSQNDFTGPITVGGGILQVGDGVTVGGGSLGTGAILNDSVIELNRPDDFTLSNSITGFGSLVKSGAGKATLTAAPAFVGGVTINEGRLAFAGGGTLQVQIDGDGTLEAAGGTLELAGFASNTVANTLVTAGTLRMNMLDGVDAAGGQVIVDGGTLTWAAPNQLGETASVTVNSGTMNTGNLADTFANLTINAVAPVSTFSGLNITGTLTVTAGTHDAVNSSGELTANAMVLSDSIIRTGANSGPSTLHIGGGGLEMTNATLQFGQVGNTAHTALLNLGGDFTGSGTNLLDVNTGNPISRIDLGDTTRTFNITSGTTTIEPDIVSITPTAGITKTGDGRLVLASSSVSTYTGDTTVSAGVLEVNGSLNGTDILVNGGTLGGSGTIQTALDGITVNAGGKLSPGSIGGVGNLKISASGAELDISDIAANSLLFDLSTPGASDRVTITAGTLNIGTGVLEFSDFVFTKIGAGSLPAGDYLLFDGSSPIIGTLGTETWGVAGGFFAELQISSSGEDLILHVIPEPTGISLLAAGLATIAGLGRRRQRVRRG